MNIDSNTFTILLTVAAAIIYIIRQEGKGKVTELKLQQAIKESGYLVQEGIKFKNKQHEFDMQLTRIDEKLNTTIEILRELKEKIHN